MIAIGPNTETTGQQTSFQEGELGSLTPGKYADVVVMSKDIMRIPEREIMGAQVDYTIVAGTVRYRREATP